MIVVFGSLNVDLVFEVAALPAAGETVLAAALTTAAGGKGANQALAAKRAATAETAVAMVGCVGADAWAETALASLAAGGVDLSRVRRGAAATGLAAVWVARGGNNAIVVAGGANRQASAAQVPDGWLVADTWLVLQMEVPHAENWALAARAHAAGCRIVLNVAPAAPVPGEVLDLIDTVVVNEVEARTIAGVDDGAAEPAEVAGRLARRHATSVIITLGAAGAVIAHEESVWSLSALPVSPVDTTGAGDAFVGALVAARHDGAPLLEAARTASAAGALATTVVGAQPSLPDAAQIAAALDGAPGPVRIG